MNNLPSLYRELKDLKDTLDKLDTKLLSYSESEDRDILIEKIDALEEAIYQEEDLIIRSVKYKTQ